MNQHPGRYLVVVAGNFGNSSSSNLAIAEAHDRGILSAASILPGGKAFEEAVRISLNRKKLSIGLRITLCDGKAVLPHTELPRLTDTQGFFEKNIVRAWFKYFRPGLRRELEKEIAAQFERLEHAGVHPDYIDSHHFMYLHPRVFPLVCRYASQKNIRWIRLPSDPFAIMFRYRIAVRGLVPFFEWTFFKMIREFHLLTAHRYGLQVVSNGYGLVQTTGIDERYFCDVFARQGSPMELSTCPDIATQVGRTELDALLSPAVHEHMRSLGIAHVGYQEL
ncbi:MAG: ChbG/HpnK family deacetylase [Nitrospirota bacterium]